MPDNRIAKERRELGMNQKELGEQLGVAQTTVSAWETGKTEPDSAALGKMAQLFHASIGYILGYEEESLTRGLPMEEYKDWMRQVREKAHQREIEKQIEAWDKEVERDGLSEEEYTEIMEQVNYDDWKHAGAPDTLEGFLVSRLVDNQPVAMREWLLQMVRDLVKVPRA